MIIRRLDAGDGLRNDGFFEDARPDANDAEEVFEAVLRAAFEDHEQKKARRMGELYANFAFEPQVSPAHASYLVELARRLTFQQLTFLGIFAEEKNEAPDWHSTGGISHTGVGVIMAIFDLAQAGLVTRRDGLPIANFTDVNPAQMRTSLNGAILTEAMHLEEIEADDLASAVDALDRLGKIVLPDLDEGGQTYTGSVRRESQRIRLEDLPDPRFPLTKLVDERSANDD